MLPSNPLSSKLFSGWRLPQRSFDLRRSGSCSLQGSAIVDTLTSPRTGVNRAIRDLMVTQIHTVWLYQCQSRRGRALSMMPAKSHSARAERFG